MKILNLFFGVQIFFLPLGVSALTPMEYYNSLVAGGEESGSRDGAFNEARFAHPLGLAYSLQGDKLYVADEENNRIRVVDLGNQNRVETLGGTGTAGKMDGPLTAASFDLPSALVVIPDDRLVVFDSGSNLLRLIDLRSKAVSTIGGNSEQIPLFNIWNLVFRPQDNSLYFTEPERKRVRRLDLKALTLQTVFENDPRIPAPRSLAVAQDKLYVADQALPKLYEIKIAPGASVSQPTAYSLEEVGKGDHILEMAFSNGTLYALQESADPLARLLPYYQPVTLPTSWGYLMESNNLEAEPFFQFVAGQPLGFVASPLEDHKLLVACPTWGKNAIYSVKDYNFQNDWITGPIQDFEYPPKKPAKTFRMLLVGDSRIVTAPMVTDMGKPGYSTDVPSLRVNSFPKQLEFLLNAEAALRGVDRHYEVLMLGHWDECPFIFSNYELKPLVEKYDVDLVCMMTSFNFDAYYTKMISPEGIPQEVFDPEFVTKPFLSRVPGGVAGKYYRDCVETGLLKKGQTMPTWSQALSFSKPLLRQDLMDLLGSPMNLGLEKLRSAKTRTGKTPGFLLFNVPWRQLTLQQDEITAFWDDFAKKNNVPFLELAPAYDALKTAFYPVNQYCCYYHYTVYGHALISFLLERELIEKKLIPFEDAPKP
jgi:hypothetical protein